MRLTRYTDYALRTLMYLALHEPNQSSIAGIARAYGISESHLTKVVHQLGQLGLVHTMRGRGGGLRLARPPSEIVIGAVVRQTEEDLALVECFANGACAITPACRLRQVLGNALAAFLDVLDGYTVADLLQDRSGADVARLLGLPEVLPPVPNSGETPLR